MKKTLLLLIFLLSFVFAKAQDTAPTDADFKTIPSFIIKYHLADSSVWIYKGTPVYGWTKLTGDLRHWWTLLTTDVTGQDTVFTRISNRDSVSLATYRLIIDTIRLKGTATVFDLRSYKVLDDSSKLYKLKTDSITNKGYYTNYKALSKKDLSDSTDTDGYTRRDRFLTGLNTKYGGSGASGQVAFHTAARTLSGDNGLFWDNTNKRLGVNTIIPGAKIQINAPDPGSGLMFRQANNTNGGYDFDVSGTTGGLTIYGNNEGPRTTLLNFDRVSGYISIGSLIANSDLEIYNAANSTIRLTRSNSGNSYGSAIWDGYDATVNEYLAIGVGFNLSRSEKIRVTSGGNVVIGDDDPEGYLFKVNGTAKVVTSVTTPTILLTTGAQENYFWKSTGTTGAGVWAAVSASQYYNGAWDANANTPTLADGTGTQGTYYHCTVSGTVDFDGAGGRAAVAFTQYVDDVAYNGTIWEKITNAQYQLLTMSASVIGGAKLGGSLQINSDVLNIANADMSDITVSGTGSDVGKIWTIDNSAVTYAKIQNVSDQWKVLGRKSASAGVVEEFDMVGTGNIVGSETPTFTGVVTIPSLVISGAGLHNYMDLKFINKAEDNWLQFATRNTTGAQAVYDLTNVGTINGLTLATAATGFTIAGGTTSKTLTVPLDASVSGTNTGDNAVNSNIGGTTNFISKFTSATAIGNSRLFDNGTYIGIIDAGGPRFDLSTTNSYSTSKTLYFRALSTYGLIESYDYAGSVGLPLSLNPNGGLVSTGGAFTAGGIVTATGGTSTDWNKYNQWDGGATGLVAATGRTSLGLVIGTNVLAYVAPGGAGNVLTSYNGAWASRTPTGTGITTLNTLTVATQTFAIGTTGTAPNWSSATSTHTLHIPMAATASVTAGLISKTQYDVFNAKLATNGSAASLTSFPDNWLINSGNDATSGTLTAVNFILSSDRRLKANIKPISDLSKFSGIKFVQFSMKSDTTNRKRFGVIAQEVEKIAPELVYTDEKGMKSVGYTDLIIAKLSAMEEEIRLLKEEIKLLKNEK